MRWKRKPATARGWSEHAHINASNMDAFTRTPHLLSVYPNGQVQVRLSFGASQGDTSSVTITGTPSELREWAKRVAQASYQ